MINRRNVFLSAMCFFVLPGTLLAAPQEKTARVSEATVQAPPVKQLSDSELSAFIAEQERQARNTVILTLLNSPDLIDDLAVVAGQLEQIKEENARFAVVTQKLRNTLQEKQTTTTDSAILEKFKNEYLEEFRKASDEYLKNVNRDVFLPHQRKRIDAICSQMSVSQMQHATAGKATWDRVLAEYFKLTSDEVDKLKKAVEKAWAELAEADKEARKNAVKQVVRTLPENKRLLLEEWALGDVETMASLLKITEN